MANFRTITDKLLRADQTPAAEVAIKFYLLAPAADSVQVVITDVIRVFTDADGVFTVPLFCGADAQLPANYRVILPNEIEYDFALSYQTGAPIRLSQLLSGGAPLDALDPLYILLDAHKVVMASASQLGHIKIGAGLAVAADGTVSATGVAGVLEWSAIENKPASFPPAAHSHSYNDLTDRPMLFDGSYNNLSNKPTLGTAAAYNVPTSGDAGADELVRGDDTRLGTGGAGQASPLWGSITGALGNQIDLQTALDRKAAASHTHTIANVTSLQAALDAKAASAHSHAIADVANLQNTLDGKAASHHTHAYSDLTGKPTLGTAAGYNAPASGANAAATELVRGDDTRLGAGAAAPSPVWGSITGILASQTDLNTALTGKAAALHTHSYNDLTDKPTLFNNDYNSLSNKPTLGSASARDVPASGNAASNQVVLGSDTRLSGSSAKTINQQFRMFTDCLGTTNTNEWVHTQSAAGILIQTGPGTGIGGAGGRRTAGCIYFSFPTATSANASIGGANPNSLCTGGGEMRFQARVCPTQESSANCTFTTVCGLSNDRTSTTPSDGVFFRYTNATANWVAVCRAGGIETAVNTGSAYLSTSDFQLLEIVINGNATQALFKINGNPVATITTNIPQYGSANVNPTIGSIKTAGSSQGYPIYIDFIETTIDFTTAR